MKENKLENFLADLENRGIISAVANKENFLALETSQQCLYLGIDCTADSLHIGHLFQLIQIIRFATIGFRIILILGGATSKIGDPSDKLKERPQLEVKEIENSYQQITTQLTNLLLTRKKMLNFIPLKKFYFEDLDLLSKIYQILQLDKQNPEKKYWQYIWPLSENNSSFQLFNNNDWLSKLSFVDFIDQVGRKITINYLLAKETIKQRVNSENGLSFMAFSYSLLQAYDFYYLYEKYNCHGQLGGSDQWGNITSGLKLIRSYYPENKCFVLTCNTLVDKEGKKISKTGNQKTIWLSLEKTSFQDLYDFFSNMSDEQVIIYVKQFTFLSDEQIEKLLVLNNPPKLRILQRILLELIFYLLHQQKGLDYLVKKS